MKASSATRKDAALVCSGRQHRAPGLGTKVGVTDVVSGKQSLTGKRTAAFSLCAHTAPQGSAGGTHIPLLSPLVRTLSLQDGAHPMTFFNFNFFLETPSPNTATRGMTAQPMNLGVHKHPMHETV